MTYRRYPFAVSEKDAKKIDEILDNAKSFFSVQSNNKVIKEIILTFPIYLKFKEDSQIMQMISKEENKLVLTIPSEKSFLIRTNLEIIKTYFREENSNVAILKLLCEINRILFMASRYETITEDILAHESLFEKRFNKLGEENDL